MLNEKISQSLAGRAAILNLLPFGYSELKNTKFEYSSSDKYIFDGFFPGIYDRQIDPVLFYKSYIQTYVERDVRLIKNITDISDFNRFLKLCAGRTGQLLNISALANECGIATNTAKGWLSLLEQSFIVFMLRPFYRNFNKRLVKMPKLYFYDTGLVCALLEIENVSQLSTHYLRGNLFENFILLELLKKRFNAGKNSNLYFWRNNHGNEIDCIIEKAGYPLAIEIKSAETFSSEFLKGLKYWQKLSGQNENNTYVIYGGDISRKTENSELLSWNALDKIDN